MRSTGDVVENYDVVLRHLYEVGVLMNNAMAHDNSIPLPPLHKWEALPGEAQVAFAIQTHEFIPKLMQLVQHIGRVLAEEAE